MRVVRAGATLAPLLLLWGLFERPAHALPTMIRLGYSNCAACHIAPQGGGLLIGYGRGIDEAQSLKGGEYQPSDSEVVKTLSLGGRITQDFRMVSQEQVATSTGQAILGALRTRFMYRNATDLGKGFRFSAIVTGENISAPRPNLKYEPGVNPAEVYVTHAMMSYRPTGKNLEVSVGRDQLPSGVNITDLSMFIKSRNRMGYYDAPTQVKLFWWGKRYHINPYAFGPAGNEHSGFHESGGGALAEFDVLGRQRTVLGLNALRGTSRNLNRNLIGPYARLGFGKWGILAEHDITDRTLTQNAALTTSNLRSFRQEASYVQLFWAVREWLVPSLVGERLTVEKPYEEHLKAVKFEVAARLSNRFTVQLGTRVQHNDLTGKIARSVTLQLMAKTVN
jgi:hypothetical protein